MSKRELLVNAGENLGIQTDAVLNWAESQGLVGAIKSVVSSYWDFAVLSFLCRNRLQLSRCIVDR